MKLSTETFTQLTKNLQDLNHEIQQRHLFMHLSTVQETKKLEKLLEELESKALNLKETSSIICHHLKILKTKCNEHLLEVSLRD